MPTLFPSLTLSKTTFLDNAGGSQLPACVIDAMTRHLRENYVQLNADYDASRRATATIARAREVVRAFLNVHSSGEVIFGSSSTSLCYQLAAAYADARDAAARKFSRSALSARDQIIVCTAGHEANVGPWMRLALRGFQITPWHAEPITTTDRELNYRPLLDTLKTLLSSRTLLVVFPQVSNLLGEVWDCRAIADMAHAAGARIVVDGVAYAPHRAPDMTAFDCDWYIYSTYKVFGPHMAAMFGKADAFAELTGPNHDFIEGGPYKWELGGANHEGCAGVAALWDFVHQALNEPVPESTPPSRPIFERAFSAFQRDEEALQARLLDYLTRKPGIRIIGPAAADSRRVSTISFTSSRARPRDISRYLGDRGIGMRWGHAYSKRLCETMGIDPDEGIARLSPVHYNTMEEIDRACALLDEIV